MIIYFKDKELVPMKTKGDWLVSPTLSTERHKTGGSVEERRLEDKSVAQENTGVVKIQR